MSYHGGVGLGQDQTAQDVSTAVTVTAGLFRDPEATLRRYGPPIVAAAERHIVDPVVGEVGKAMGPYAVKYILPPLAVLYVLTGISAYYSWKNYQKGRPRANPSRRRRRRRTSRRRR